MEELEKYYNLNYVKSALREWLLKGSEPELCIKIDGKEYMIIPLNERLSFQWIGETSEFYFETVEELFSSVLVNGLVLDRDWNRVEDIRFM